MYARKLSNQQRDEVAAKYVSGKTHVELAKEYGVCKGTISKICAEKKAFRPDKVTTSGGDLASFKSRARSVLWRQDGAEKKTFEAWKARVEALQAPDGGKLTHNQAIVRASKEFPCLHRLFREYDLRSFDPNPESHPDIRHWGNPVAQPGFQKPSVLCENIEQTHRDNLNWAITTAGEFLRTGREPVTCPNDAAYYLYEQAKAEPKEFLSRFNQIEAKGDIESEEKRNIRKAGKRSLAEIDSMLAELKPEEESTDEQTKVKNPAGPEGTEEG
jgi:hypothetical protein